MFNDNFMKHYLIPLILLGCIVYLFLDNLRLKDELKKLRDDLSYVEIGIGHEAGELCPPPYLVPGSGILGRLCNVENMVEALEYEISNRLRY